MPKLSLPLPPMRLPEMDAVQRIAGAAVGSSENAVNEGERLQRLAEELEQSVNGFKMDPERAALHDAELNALPRGLT